MKYNFGLSWSQKLIGLSAIIVWILVFTAGLLVNSEPYRNVVANHSYIKMDSNTINEPNNPKSNIIKAWVVVILCYTPTNIIFLCMTGGLLGSLSRIAILHASMEGEPELPSDKTNPLISGLFRGIFVYLLVTSGVLIISEAPFTNPSQIQYTRLAGFMSLLSFLLSYNPNRFRNFLKSGFDRFEGTLQKDRNQKE